MFKIQLFRRLITVVVIGLIVLSSVSANAMQSPGGGKSNNGTPARNLMAQMAALAAGMSPALLQQAVQIFNAALRDRRIEAAQAAREAATPEGFVRAPKRGPDGEKAATFGSPESMGANGEDVVYLRCEEHIEWYPKIDLEGAEVTFEQLIALLEAHPQFARLERLLQRDLPRYIGICLNLRDNERYSQRRMQEEEREAFRCPDRRHAHWTRHFLTIHQNLIINVNPNQAKEIEGWLIRRFETNHGNGLNSNPGKGSKKLKLLDPVCHALNFGDKGTDRDPDDDSGDRSDSTSSTEATLGASLQMGSLVN